MINTVYKLIDLIFPIALYYAIFYSHSFSHTLNPDHSLAFLSGLFMLVFNDIRGFYHKSKFYITLSDLMELTTKSWASTVLILILYLILIDGGTLTLSTIFITWFVLTPLIIILLKILATNTYKKKAKPVNLLCVGKAIKLTKYESQRIEANNIQLKCIENLYCANRLTDIDSIIFNYDFAPPIEEIKELTHLELSGIKVISANQFYEKYLQKCYIPYIIRDIEFMNDVKKLHSPELILKKLIDLSSSACLMLFFFPLMIYSVFKIKQQSPGSIFFKQERVGYMMKPFTVFKFRSMHENSEFNPYTQKKDDRVFSYGRQMRKLRIDELPQVWNVLKGNMHLIGPRAEWTILVENYEKEIPYYHERHLIRPGITGWAQVMYPYGGNTEDSRQKLMYDLYYIKHWSIWLELETIFRTIGVVLGKKGL